MECPSTANICYQCGYQFNLSQASNRAASSVEKKKTVKGVFRSGISLRSIDYAHRVTAVADVLKSWGAFYRKF